MWIEPVAIFNRIFIFSCLSKSRGGAGLREQTKSPFSAAMLLRTLADIQMECQLGQVRAGAQVGSAHI